MWHAILFRPVVLAAVMAIVGSAFVATATAPGAAAATVVQTWQTRIGASGAWNDAATLRAFDTGKGTLRIQATKLRAGVSYTVTVYRGRCGWMATRLFTLPSVTTTSSGSVTRNLGLSVAQLRTVRSNWNAGNGVAIQLARGSSKRCGGFGAYATTGSAVRLEDEQTHTVTRAEAWPGSGLWTPSAGSSYVTVQVRIKARTRTSYNAMDYSLIDGTGKEWSGLVLGDREPSIGSGSLSAGQTVQGWVTLMAPTNQLGKLILAYRMNSFLYGPTLYVRLGTLASPEPPLGLRAAIDAGKVTITGQGVNLEHLDLTIASQVNAPLDLAVAPGLMFRPTAGATQSMVTTQGQTVVLAPMERKTVTLHVACAAMHLGQPGSGDQFSLEPSPISAALQQLLQLPDFADHTFRVQQFAIWTITDNPPRTGYVALGTFGFGSGPSDGEMATIRQLFVTAGLDPAAYQAFG